MSYLFAVLYPVCFIVAVVFLVKALLGKKKGNDTSKDKIIAIISFVLFVVFFILTGVTAPPASEKPSSTISSVENDNDSVVSEKITDTKTAEDTNNSTPSQDSNAEDATANEAVDNTNNDGDNDVSSTNDAIDDDLSIIVREGHPTYYGSVETSHDIWDDVEEGKIHFGDGIYGHNDKPILSMSAYRNEDTIRQVIINFANFDNNPNLSIDEVIPITVSYMPFDIMDKWYEYKGSEIISPDEASKDTYYIVSYRLTDEGKSAYKKEHQYSGTIDVIIEVNKDIVQNVDITFGTPRWMSSLSQNKYHKEEWACDLYDYR